MARNSSKIKNAIQDTEINAIKEHISRLDHSFRIINDHTTQLSQDMAKVKSDINWLVWGQRTILFGLIVALVLYIVEKVI